MGTIVSQVVSLISQLGGKVMMRRICPTRNYIHSIVLLSHDKSSMRTELKRV